MASIQHTDKNTWRVQIYRNGKRRSGTFKNEEDAKRWAAKIEGRIDATDHLALSVIPKRVLDAISSVPYTITEVLEAAIPTEDMIGVYFLIKDDEVIYVGQSGIDILARVAKHKREGRKFDSYAYIRCDKEDIDALEEKYIAAFVPRLNLSFGRSRIGRIKVEQ